ncbi:hypothetical protein ES703_87359 [subsurface metagenome]
MFYKIPNCEKRRKIAVMVKEGKIDSERILLNPYWIQRFELKIKCLLANSHEI